MSSLQEAREAIQSGNLPAAQAIIADVLKSDQNNAEAWFLLSEATAGDRKLIFLNKAINLDPNLQEAVQRKAELEGTAEPEPEPELMPEPEEEENDGSSFSTIPPADFEAFGDPEDDEPEEEELPIATPAETQAMSPSPPASVSPSAVQSASTDEDAEEAAPSNLINTLGFAFSLALSAVLFILFIRAVLDLF